MIFKRSQGRFALSSALAGVLCIAAAGAATAEGVRHGSGTVPLYKSYNWQVTGISAARKPVSMRTKAEIQRIFSRRRAMAGSSSICSISGSGQRVRCF